MSRVTVAGGGGGGETLPGLERISLPCAYFKTNSEDGWEYVIPASAVPQADATRNFLTYVFFLRTKWSRNTYNGRCDAYVLSVDLKNESGNLYYTSNGYNGRLPGLTTWSFNEPSSRYFDHGSSMHGGGSSWGGMVGFSMAADNKTVQISGPGQCLEIAVYRSTLHKEV